MFKSYKIRKKRKNDFFGILPGIPTLQIARIEPILWLLDRPKCLTRSYKSVRVWFPVAEKSFLLRDFSFLLPKKFLCQFLQIYLDKNPRSSILFNAARRALQFCFPTQTQIRAKNTTYGRKISQKKKIFDFFVPCTSRNSRTAKPKLTIFSALDRPKCTHWTSPKRQGRFPGEEKSFLLRDFFGWNFWTCFSKFSTRTRTSRNFSIVFLYRAQKSSLRHSDYFFATGALKKILCFLAWVRMWFLFYM